MPPKPKLNESDVEANNLTVTPVILNRTKDVSVQTSFLVPNGKVHTQTFPTETENQIGLASALTPSYEEISSAKRDHVTIECATKNPTYIDAEKSNDLIANIKPDTMNSSTGSHYKIDVQRLLRMLIKKLNKTNQIVLFMLAIAILSLCVKFYEIVYEKLRYDMMTSYRST